MAERDPRGVSDRNSGGYSPFEDLRAGEERVLELREEQLVANKQLREVGEILIRKEVDTAPARLEVDALREEVEVVHEPVGQSVSERREPWEEDGDLVVPVYEEQLVVTKRLVLRERLRVRRLRTTERQLFEQPVRRERLVVEDPQQTGLVRELYPTDEASSPETSTAPVDKTEAPSEEPSDGNFLTKLVSRALE